MLNVQSRFLDLMDTQLLNSIREIEEEGNNYEKTYHESNFIY